MRGSRRKDINNSPPKLEHVKKALQQVPIPDSPSSTPSIPRATPSASRFSPPPTLPPTYSPNTPNIFPSVSSPHALGTAPPPQLPGSAHPAFATSSPTPTLPPCAESCRPRTSMGLDSPGHQQESLRSPAWGFWWWSASPRERWLSRGRAGMFGAWCLWTRIAAGRGA